MIYTEDILKQLKIEKEKCRSEIEKLVYNKIKELYGDILFLPKVEYGWGVGHFNHLFWWRVRINATCLKSPYNNAKYEYIYFMPYIVDEETINALNHKLKFEESDQKYWGKNSSSEYPHIDSTTGNIHVEFSPQEWIKNPGIKQLILVRNVPQAHYGPKLEMAEAADIPEEELNIYTLENKQFCVPKKCYANNLNELINHVL